MKMRGAWIIIAILALAAVCVSADDAAPLPPCKKAPKAKLLSIEHRYPTLVKDYHPVDDAINPNLVKGKDADRVARVIIREHLEWEKDNPPPPPNETWEELRDMGIKIDEETKLIKDGQKAFANLAKFVDQDHAEYERAEKERIAKVVAADKQKAADAAAKEQSKQLLAAVAAKRAAIAAEQKKNEAARAAAHAAADKKNPASVAATAPKPKVPASKASKKITALKQKVAAPKKK